MYIRNFNMAQNQNLPPPPPLPPPTRVKGDKLIPQKPIAIIDKNIKA